VGYKIHLSESCDEQSPHLITHVETTPSTVQDVEVVERIHASLADKGLLPAEHVLDMGYVSLDLMVTSQLDYQVELVGEVRPDTSWQATAQAGFDLTHLAVDWTHRQVTCPMGQTSARWKNAGAVAGTPVIRVVFAKESCEHCPCRDQCTTGTVTGRQLTLPADQATFDTLRQARAYQHTAEFKTRYKTRAGIEGTLSQAVNTLDIRRSRYIGLAKTHLQHLLSATALNILRAVHWLLGEPLAKTRTAPFQALAAPS
jgi:transposase